MKIDGNFHQLLHLISHSEECLVSIATLLQFLQNEIIKVMPLTILLEIAARIKNRPFTIMLDETIDAGSYRGTVCSSSTLGRR